MKAPVSGPQTGDKNCSTELAIELRSSTLTTGVNPGPRNEVSLFSTSPGGRSKGPTGYMTIITSFSQGFMFFTAKLKQFVTSSSGKFEKFTNVNSREGTGDPGQTSRSVENEIEPEDSVDGS
jgi:hypothetical protein